MKPTIPNLELNSPRTRQHTRPSSDSTGTENASPSPGGEGRGEGEPSVARATHFGLAKPLEWGEGASGRNRLQLHQKSKIKNQKSANAFTLIEMLVVIAIIGILAALIIGGAGYAITAGKKSRVNAERDALVTAIQSYKNKMGFYPPDNTNNPAQSSLFYELTGTTNDGNGGNFYSPVSGEVFANSAAVTSLFNVGGFMNSSPDPNNVRNFAPAVAKSGGTGQVITSGLTNTQFGVPISGPANFMMNTLSGKIFNPWHYVSTNPTNNQGSFDLWMDVLWGGKTNRISNWTPDPVPVSY